MIKSSVMIVKKSLIFSFKVITSEECKQSIVVHLRRFDISYFTYITVNIKLFKQINSYFSKR